MKLRKSNIQRVLERENRTREKQGRRREEIRIIEEELNVYYHEAESKLKEEEERIRRGRVFFGHGVMIVSSCVLASLAASTSFYFVLGAVLFALSLASLIVYYVYEKLKEGTP